MIEPTRTSQRALESVVLAAGKGTRMGGDRAKVLYPTADRPMIDWVIDAIEQAGCNRSIIVVGHQADDVKKALADRTGIAFALQNEQLGTGHAVMIARAALGDLKNKDVLVLCGDGPLIRAQTIRTLIDRHRATGAAATLATAIIDDPTGYGRIVRDAEGRLAGIVEHKDADDTQRAILEINPSYYCFDAQALFSALDRIDNQNAKGEYYLTDVFALLRADGLRVEVVDAVPAEDILSINTPDQLATVDAILRHRANQEAAT